MSPLKDHTNPDLLDLADARDVTVPGGKNANKDTILEALEAAGVEDDALDDAEPVEDDDIEPSDADAPADEDGADDGEGDDDPDVADVLDDEDDDIEPEPNTSYGASLDEVPSVAPDAAKRLGDNAGAVPARVETGDAGEVKSWWCGQCGRSHTVEFDICEACNTPALGITAVEPEVIIHDDDGAED